MTATTYDLRLLFLVAMLAALVLGVLHRLILRRLLRKARLPLSPDQEREARARFSTNSNPDGSRAGSELVRPAQQETTERKEG